MPEERLASMAAPEQRAVQDPFELCPDLFAAWLLYFRERRQSRIGAVERHLVKNCT
jgi:hypothetical protein